MMTKKTLMDRINPFSKEIEGLDFDEYKQKMTEEIDIFWQDMNEDDETNKIVDATIPDEKYKAFCVQVMTYLWLFVFTVNIAFSVIVL